MICQDLPPPNLRCRKRCVCGASRGFRVVDQALGQRMQCRRAHRRCIGCEENKRDRSTRSLRSIFLFGRDRISARRARPVSRPVVSSAAARRAWP
jgi:hypothetical protein